MKEPIIKPAPTEMEIKALVDELITPEHADVQAKALIDLLDATTSADDEVQIDLANVAKKHAFCKTMAFENALHNFSGFPVSGFPPPPGTIQITGRAG